MKFYIPSIGDKLRVTQDWVFSCFCEHRNNNFIERMRPDVPKSSIKDGASFSITIEAGTILTVDRIYIRKGKGPWDSVTFVAKFANKPISKPKGFSNTNRFWAKLIDANEIECEKVND